MSMENSSAPTSLSTPKFSTSSPINSLQTPISSSLTFQLANISQKAGSQTNMSVNAHQSSSCKGLNIFQLPNTVNSIAPQFSMNSSTVTATINQEYTKPALLITSMSQANNSVIPQIISVPSTKPGANEKVLV